MPDPKAQKEIPGTTVFSGERSVAGDRMNKFAAVLYDMYQVSGCMARIWTMLDDLERRAARAAAS